MIDNQRGKRDPIRNWRVPVPKTVAGRYRPGAVREPIKVCLVIHTWRCMLWLGGGGDGIWHTKPIGITIRQPIKGEGDERGRHPASQSVLSTIE